MNDVIEFFKAHPTLGECLKLAATATGAIVLLMIVLKLEQKLARKFLHDKKNINVRFVENILRFVLILVTVQWVVLSSPLTRPFGQVLFQGTTVIAAIAGFAAQPVIADLICGLMMSATRPFNLGERIELEDGTSGIVKDITMRHVVLQGPDTMELVIPNSKLNGMRLRNMSRPSGLRSIFFRFNVAYHTDVEEACAIVRRAVEECPLAVPGKPGQGKVDYAPVYFLEYAESSLVLATTVYYTAANSTEAVKSDVNTRVKRALESAGIEIPYKYVNVVVSGENKT